MRKKSAGRPQKKQKEHRRICNISLYPHHEKIIEQANLGDTSKSVRAMIEDYSAGGTWRKIEKNMRQKVGFFSTELKTLCDNYRVQKADGLENNNELSNIKNLVKKIELLIDVIGDNNDLLTELPFWDCAAYLHFTGQACSKEFPEESFPLKIKETGSEQVTQ